MICLLRLMTMKSGGERTRRKYEAFVRRVAPISSVAPPGGFMLNPTLKIMDLSFNWWDPL
jgi:hypothetical protein